MKKINPNFGQMGAWGYKDDDDDTNCPYYGRHMGRRHGYGMGPCYGRGPGSMGRAPEQGEFVPGYGRLETPLKEEGARTVVENYLQSTRNPNLRLGKITEQDDAFEAEIVTKDGSLVDKLLVDKSTGNLGTQHPACTFSQALGVGPDSARFLLPRLEREGQQLGPHSLEVGERRVKPIGRDRRRIVHIPLTAHVPLAKITGVVPRSPKHFSNCGYFQGKILGSVLRYDQAFIGAPVPRQKINDAYPGRVLSSLDTGASG